MKVSNKTLTLILCLLGQSNHQSLAWAPATPHRHYGTIIEMSSSGDGDTKVEASIGSNVVLAPSEDASAFDSLKLGSPRVHRYSREGSEGSEYIMWYHGRDASLSDAPPLSTGRIGKATSRNGLHWTKEKQGSESEDASDVSLGLNKESWWCFDTGHVGLGQVLLPMSLPSVISEGGVYMMYYMGGSLEENEIMEFMPNDAPDMGDKKVTGMKMKIGVALSQDGTTFGRIEGDDPTGAIMVPYDKSMGKVTGKNKMDVLDIEEELYCGWPDVVPIIDGKDDFLMYYSTMLKDTKEKVIAFGVSKNGVSFGKRGVCLRPEAGTPDEKGCARCTVFENQEYNENGRWTKSEGFTMLYEGGKVFIYLKKSINLVSKATD